LKKRIYGVAGYPILHSRSPEMFNDLFKDTENVYTRFSSSNPLEIIKMIKDIGITGLNVTTPLKDTMVKYLDYVSDDVVRTEAVNTIVCKDGALYGYNTDCDGVSGAILRKGIDINGKRSVVIGSGGAGRAAVCGLQDFGSKVYLTNRTGEKLEYYSKLLSCEVFKSGEVFNQIKQADIVVNTAPYTSVKPILDKMDRNQILLNADYKETSKVKSKLTLIDGLSWLLYQGASSYRIFFNREPNIKQMEVSIRTTKREERKTIVLIGYMGSGKSILGKNIGEVFKRLWIDSDDFIEHSSGVRIEDIFIQDGEVEFRRLEEKALIDLLRIKEPLVISVGGGAILSESNRMILKANATNIWLWCSNSKIEERLIKSKRPLIKKTSDIKKHYLNRVGFYSEVADMVISNTEDINEVVRRVKMELMWE